jgi:hypothetical protein
MICAEHSTGSKRQGDAKLICIYFIETKDNGENALIDWQYQYFLE